MKLELFEVDTSQKLSLLTKEDLVSHIYYYKIAVGRMRKQFRDLRRENDRLKSELGIGETILMPFKIEKL